MSDIKGYIHSFHSLGAVDGPGVRYVVFMQGCPYRCPYCHNPDTRAFSGGVPYSASEVATMVERYRPYFTGGGGITVSGGEPLCQADFVAELFEKLHSKGINTCLDTATVKVDKKVLRVLASTDTVLCDVKFPTREKYLKHVGADLNNTLEFLKTCNEMGVKVIIRHVVVPGMTDSEDSILKLKELLSDIKYEKIELLPFKKLCMQKYKSMGIEFPLKDTPECSKDTIENLKKLL
jgi:pyruvate formate lyase activating enzyme